MFSDWDKKEVRAICIGFVFFALSISTDWWLRPLSSGLLTLISNVSTRFADALYHRASMDPIANSIALIIPVCIVLPFMVIVAVGKTARSLRSPSQSPKPTPKFYRIFTALFFIEVVFGGALIFSIYVVPLIVNAEFQRDLAALSGFITEQQKNGLLSRWAYMDTQAEYYGIMHTIESYFAEHGLKPPHPVR